jgi:hypothetical protein
LSEEVALIVAVSRASSPVAPFRALPVAYVEDELLALIVPTSLPPSLRPGSPASARTRSTSPSVTVAAPSSPSLSVLSCASFVLSFLRSELTSFLSCFSSPSPFLAASSSLRPRRAPTVVAEASSSPSSSVRRRRFLSDCERSDYFSASSPLFLPSSFFLHPSSSLPLLRRYADSQLLVQQQRAFADFVLFFPSSFLLPPSSFLLLRFLRTDRLRVL